MISQIPGGAEGLDQLICDGKNLRGSAIETEDGNHRFVAQVTLYARALGVALTGLGSASLGSPRRSRVRKGF